MKTHFKNYSRNEFYNILFKETKLLNAIYLKTIIQNKFILFYILLYYLVRLI